MKIYSKKLFVILALSFLFFWPLVGIVHAQSPSIPTDCNRGFVTCCEGSNCDFAQLMIAVQKIVNFAIKFALGFSIVVIAYAGWKYLTSGGEPGKRKEANEMFVKVAKGIFFVLAAWLIVNLIMTSLVKSPNVKNLISNTSN